ncbi:protein phosphatase [Blastococcus sp. TF02-8]|uniref:phosphatase domain-containing protein n=1 Tax=Blastococcus sp. TF02-8 TaxID=2250574 RepID=UPI000DE9E75D|nr:protein phosphatase [Blastococcus sp. TF02-8]RBY93547.1 protein phosphatase [Blastococcus sp. TF02-8]
MSEPWDPAAPGVLMLPSGRLVRGRSLRAPRPPGALPDLGVYLARHPGPPTDWESRWIRCPDFRLPRDPAELRTALVEAWERSATERVEVACGGGTGRTGTALACLAVLDGIPPDEAVAFVRARYRRRAVETRGQRQFVRGFG